MTKKAPKHWIQGMHMEKGGLHESLHVPANQPVPEKKLEAAARGAYGPTAQKQAQLAKTFGKLRKGK